MKPLTLTTLFFICFAIVTFFACNKLKDCITYPEDTVPICGATHTWISGKTWDLDSVILNGKNITQQVWDSLGANSYGFRIGIELTQPGFNKQADAAIFIGNQGYSAIYFQDQQNNIDVEKDLYISPSDSVTASLALRQMPIAGIHGTYGTSIDYPIRHIQKLESNNLKLNAIFSDTLIENYFSVK